MKNIEESSPVPFDTNIAYHNFLREKLDRSLQDIQHGRVMTIQESKKRLNEKYADFILF